MLNERFNPSIATGILVLVTWEDGSSPFALTNIIKLWNFGNELKQQPGVSEVTSAVTPPDLGRFGSPAEWFAALAGEASGSSGGVKGGLSGDAYLELKRLMSATAGPGALLYVVVPKWKDNSPQTRALATRLADVKPPPGTTIWVAGVAAGLNDFLRGLYGRFPWVVIYVLCATFVVFLVMLRSLLLPFKAVIVNGLSILASFGALVFIFQEGHFESVLGFESSGWVESTLPVILFCIIFGVSMDYEVFMLTRMREYWLETHDNARSVGMGLARTGRIITSAALIIVVVAGAFAFTSIVVTKALGVGLAIAVALDATIVRVLLVPAAMRLFGHWNWWLPKWLDKVIPRVITR
jgi:RND superfamily putative drug exporter